MAQPAIVQWGAKAAAVSTIAASIGAVATWVVFPALEPPVREYLSAIVSEAIGDDRFKARLSDMIGNAIEAEVGGRIDAAFEKRLPSIETTPPLRFSGNVREHNMTASAPGSYGRLSWRLVKVRDCGRPLISITIINGDGISHAVPNDDIRITTRDGRGVSLPVSLEMQSIDYLVRVPDDAAPGRATLLLTLSDFEACRFVAPIRAPAVSFTIVDPAD